MPVVPTLHDPVRQAAPLDAALPDLIRALKGQGLEGLVAKPADKLLAQVNVAGR